MALFFQSTINIGSYNVGLSHASQMLRALRNFYPHK
jgi:hypothetical protein